MARKQSSPWQPSTHSTHTGDRIRTQGSKARACTHARMCVPKPEVLPTSIEIGALAVAMVMISPEETEKWAQTDSVGKSRSKGPPKPRMLPERSQMCCSRAELLCCWCYVSSAAARTKLHCESRIQVCMHDLSAPEWRKRHPRSRM